MQNQQILNFIDLVSQYPSKQTRSQSLKSTQYPQLKGRNGDSNIFKLFVQEKIKLKYQETKTHKLSLKGKCKTIEMETESEHSVKENNKKILHTQEIERTFFPDNIKASNSGMHKHDSLEKLINKKDKLFLKTSNLLIPSLTSSLKEKISLKSDLFKVKVSQCSSHQLRNNHIDLNLRQRISNYGYELDGSIYNFEERRRQQTQDIEKQLIRNTEHFKTKNDIYQYLRGTSPLTIKKKAMKYERETNPFQKKHQVEKQKMISYTKAKKNGSRQIKHGDIFKMVPSQLSHPSSIYLKSKQDGICGWEHEQQN